MQRALDFQQCMDAVPRWGLRIWRRPGGQPTSARARPGGCKSCRACSCKICPVSCCTLHDGAGLPLPPAGEGSPPLPPPPPLPACQKSRWKPEARCFCSQHGEEGPHPTRVTKSQESVGLQSPAGVHGSSRGAGMAPHPAMPHWAAAAPLAGHRDSSLSAAIRCRIAAAWRLLNQRN